jgi:hypothetical protein
LHEFPENGFWKISLWHFMETPRSRASMAYVAGNAQKNRERVRYEEGIVFLCDYRSACWHRDGDDVGVRVGPVGAGVPVGEDHDHHRDRDRTTVVKEREPRDNSTVIKKEDEDGNRSKTVIHRDNDGLK